MADQTNSEPILTSKQAKFLASYQLTGDATESAKNAGYAAKSAAVEGHRLLKNAKIQQELAKWKQKKASEISKEDFVDIALDRFNRLEITEPNSPRFLDLAGKALGHIGAQTQQNSTTNNVQINIALTGSESQTELWEITRKLLGNQ